MQCKHIGSWILWILISCTTARAQTVSLAADSVCGVTGASLTVPVRANEFQNMIGCQGSLDFDPAVLRFDSIDSFGLPFMSSANFGTNNAASGILTFSWDDPNANGVSVPNGSPLFTLSFTLLGQPGDSTSLRFLDSPTLLEFFDVNFNAFQPGTTSGWMCVENPGVGIAEAVPAGSRVEVFPTPATFESRVRIATWGEAGALRVYDLQGRLLNEVEVAASAKQTIEYEWGQICPHSSHRQLLMLSWEGPGWLETSFIPSH